MRIFRLLLCVFTLVFFFPLPAEAAKKQTVRLVYVEWPCAVVTHNLAKVAIEERLPQYEVELIAISVPLMFKALSSGEAEATMAAWLPNTHKSYLESLKDKLADLGPLVTGARLGWVVPDYLPYTSMEDLRGHAAEFRGNIYGIEPGAVYMDDSRKAIDAYGLEGFTLVESSDAVMIAMLEEAIKKNAPVVVTGWAPHWKFGKWKLHFLADPKGLFGAEEAIHTVARKGLKEDMPEIYAFLDNFHFTDTAQLQRLMAENMEKGTNEMENARRFVKENKEQVDAWFK